MKIVHHRDATKAGHPHHDMKTAIQASALGQAYQSSCAVKGSREKDGRLGGVPGKRLYFVGVVRECGLALLAAQVPHFCSAVSRGAGQYIRRSRIPGEPQDRICVAAWPQPLHHPHQGPSACSA